MNINFTCFSQNLCSKLNTKIVCWNFVPKICEICQIWCEKRSFWLHFSGKKIQESIPALVGTKNIFESLYPSLTPRVISRVRPPSYPSTAKIFVPPSKNAPLPSKYQGGLPRYGCKQFRFKLIVITINDKLSVTNELNWKRFEFYS